MPIHIHTIDASNNDNGLLARARHNHQDAILTNCVLDVVVGILQRVGDNRIDRIDIIGHGHPGQLNVGGGTRPESHQVIAINENGYLFNRNILALLCGHFVPNALVRLHACRLAQGWRGELLLFSLADLWQIRVQGGLATQFPDCHDRFEGRMYFESNGTPGNLAHATYRNR
jgi:hypothetical protein